MAILQIVPRHRFLTLFTALIVLLASASCSRPASSASDAATATDVAPTQMPTPTSLPSPTVVPTPTVVPAATPAPATSDDAQTVSVDAGDALQVGIDVYLANYCGLCHTLTVAGTKGIFGPSHDHIGRVAQERLADPEYTGQATTPQEYLYESLVDPRAFAADDYKLTRHPMPAFTHLSDEDLNALVELLLAQK